MDILKNIIICVMLQYLLLVECLSAQNSNLFSFYLSQIESAPLYEGILGDSLVLYSFEKEWDKPDYYHDKKAASKATLSEQLLDTLAFHYYQKFAPDYCYTIDSCRDNSNIIVINKDDFDLFFNITPDIPLEKSVIRKIKSDKIRTLAFKIADKTNYQIYSLSTESLEIDCGNCEYQTRVSLQAFICIQKAKLIDSYIVAFDINDSLNGSFRYFIYDKEDTIHIKDFATDELGGSFRGYKKYGISPQGKYKKF